MAVNKETKQLAIPVWDFSFETSLLRKYIIHPFFLFQHHSFKVPEVLVREDGNVFSSLLRREISQLGLDFFFDRFWPKKCHISEVLAPESLLTGTSSILSDKIVNGRFTVQLITVMPQKTERQEARASSFIRISNQTSGPVSAFGLTCRCPTVEKPSNA